MAKWFVKIVGLIMEKERYNKMEIIKVETIKMGDFTRRIVHIEHNGMDAYFNLDDLFHPNFYEELEQFRRTFFDNTEVDWKDCMENDHINETFDGFNFIHNKDNDKHTNENMLRGE